MDLLYKAICDILRAAIEKRRTTAGSEEGEEGVFTTYIGISHAVVVGYRRRTETGRWDSLWVANYYPVEKKLTIPSALSKMGYGKLSELLCRGAVEVGFSQLAEVTDDFIHFIFLGEIPSPNPDLEVLL